MNTLFKFLFLITTIFSIGSFSMAGYLLFSTFNIEPWSYPEYLGSGIILLIFALVLKSMADLKSENEDRS